MTDLIFKILTLSEWDKFARSGRFVGSVHDKRDGFIHLCSGPQLKGTLDKHYGEFKEIVLVGFNGAGFGNDLKWEVSRGGEKFPHLYAELLFSALVNVNRLPQSQNGGFDLPMNI